MVATRSLVVLLFVGVALATPTHVRRRRQLADDNTLQPIEDAEGDEQTREKRKLAGITQAKLGIKNAILGLLFDNLNSFIDSKTSIVEHLDKRNIEINKKYGIEAPQNALTSLGDIIGPVVQSKLQFIGPKLQAVTSLFSGSSASGSSGGQGGGLLGSALSFVSSLSGAASGGPGAGATVETIDSSEEDDSS